MMKFLRPILAAFVFLTVFAGAGRAQEIFDAVKNSDLAKAKVMIEGNPSLVNTKDAAGNTPLHHAAMIGSVEMVEFLFQGR